MHEQPRFGALFSEVSRANCVMFVYCYLLLGYVCEEGMVTDTTCVVSCSE
jgi:hypothetical protein